MEYVLPSFLDLALNLLFDQKGFLVSAPEAALAIFRMGVKRGGRSDLGPEAQDEARGIDLMWRVDSAADLTGFEYVKLANSMP